jgi:hypothetical protein
MDEKEYQLGIIGQMAKNEVKLSELYLKYSHKFPSRKEFWNDLALEEVSHGAWIRNLKKSVDDGGVSFSDERFNMDLNNDFYKHIAQKELEITDTMPLIEALTTSMEIEEMMLENKFFEVFHGDAPELETLLLSLEYATKNHREIVLKALDEEKKLLAA